MGDLLELIVPATDRFEIFSMETELVKAYEDPTTKKKMFRGVASSTTKDLHGDTILLSALEDMEKSAVGLTMFLNHSYDVPGDVGGTITKAITKQKGVDEKGDPNYQLEIEGEVEEDNDEALKTWRFVQKGRKIGLSIGAMIPKDGAKRQKDGSYLIEHLILLEVSFVGIPANPKSWVDYAASALRGMIEKATTTNLGNPTLTLEGGRYRIEGSIEGIDLGLETEPIVEPVPTIEYNFAQALDGKTIITRSTEWPVDQPDGSHMGKFETLGAWDLADPDDKLVAIASINKDVIEKATVWVETRDGDKITIGEPVNDAASLSNDIDPDITDAGCPTCGGSKSTPNGNCSNDYHSAAAPDPDVQDAKIRIIEVDTSDPQSPADGQGASDSEPDDSLSAPAADVSATGEPVILEGLPEDELVKLSFGQLRAVALRTTTELVETRKALGEEKQARIEAERQRDAVIETAGELVKKTAAIIEKIANSPLPRRASIKQEFKQEFASADIEGYYGEAMARAIASK
jgi:phage head maturation protease